MYLLTHSLSPVPVLVVMMKSKELKTKIYSHTDSLILSLSVSATCWLQGVDGRLRVPVPNRVLHPNEGIPRLASHCVYSVPRTRWSFTLVI